MERYESWVIDKFQGENDALPDSQIAEYEAAKLTNLIPSKDGEPAKVRQGTTQVTDFSGVATDPTDPITALHRFLPNGAGSMVKMGATRDKVFVYDQSGSTLKHTWNNKASDTRFCDHYGFIFASNGVEPIQWWDGKSAAPAQNGHAATTGTFSTVTDRGNAGASPIAPYMISYRGRLWCAGGDTLYFSGVQDDLNQIAGTSNYYWRFEDWSNRLGFPSSGGWGDINPGDGQDITGLGQLYNGVVVFKEHDIFMFVYDIEHHPSDPSYSAVNTLVSGTGCVSHDTITYDANSIVFLGQNAAKEIGVFRLNGSGVTPLSNRVPEALKRVVAGGSSPRATIYGHHYIVAASEYGSGTTGRTLVYVYDLVGNVWFEFKGWNVGCFEYNPDTDRISIGCGDSARVVEYPFGYTDEGKPIKWTWRSRVYDFGDPHEDKRIRLVSLFFVTLAVKLGINISIDSASQYSYEYDFEAQNVDSWPIEDADGNPFEPWDHSVWEDDSLWYDDTLECRVDIPLPHRGRTLQAEVNGTSSEEFALRRAGGLYAKMGVKYR